MPLTYRIEHFEGPLDLLLQLVEAEQLDISAISLSKVAEQFVDYVHTHPDIPLEELADFLVVASKLVWIKSKLLFPDLEAVAEDEGPDLETQLRLYRAYVAASRHIDRQWKAGLRSFPRSAPTVLVPSGFVMPPGLSTAVLQDIMQRVIRRLEPIAKLPQASLERVVSVQETIRTLYEHIRAGAKSSFRKFLGKQASKPEAVAAFMALLELVKQRFIVVSQDNRFDDIAIEAHPTPPTEHPILETV